MLQPLTTRLNAITQAIRNAFSRAGALAPVASPTGVARAGRFVFTAGLVAAGAWALWAHPPLQTIARGEVGVRVNQLTGGAGEFQEGSLIVIPGLHELRLYSLRDQVFRPAQSARAGGEAPFQSVEGLSLGVDLAVRFALDPAKIGSISRNLPDDIGGQVVQPAVQGVIYKVFTRYTVREIFSTKRAEIQQAIEAELKPKLAADGILLRAVQIGKVDLPADYRRGMDTLLSEELATARMRYTLELKEKRIKETELDGEADRVKREKSAQAAGNEQIIAARAQEEAMKHVLPFKQRQIEQRLLEAEAEKQARIRSAEGSSQARRIEAAGEADSRQKLADAEAYRLDRVGKISSEQMARDGALISKHPLLIQKTLADKLSDKITVIIAPPGTNGSFLGAGLVGGQAQAAQVAARQQGEDEAERDNARGSK